MRKRAKGELNRSTVITSKTNKAQVEVFLQNLRRGRKICLVVDTPYITVQFRILFFRGAISTNFPYFISLFQVESKLSRRASQAKNVFRTYIDRRRIQEQVFGCEAD